MRNANNTQMITNPAIGRIVLKNDGLFEKLDTKICIGQGYRGKTGKLGVGACTCKFEHNVKGCPPTENQIYDFLKQYILGENK